MMMMTANRKRRKPVSEINVVPYIDVMLVLLIIFMVTAPLITQGVKVDLPNANAEPLDAESKPPIIVSVDVDGQYYVSSLADYNNPNDPLDIETLAARVQAQLTLDPETRIMVNGDGGVSYNQVVRLMVLLQQLGVDSVGLMTEDTGN
ncbi:Biopolymer transport protein ExbD [Pseudidiomarina piscicola]|uniref:Tol-Pal system protein TolR n=2 Tax=Pseudidiomarina piscicola TaxID=2614830 RepID=A0A6S6WKJ6_9GAMM|nr:Biopolymer transport protein ExbD [Pseudidiomarina piscicola]VZT38913.1 Biopolymer transport protein ExbD [Pseudomonas aeruginosa]